jgi:mono/diheme cytochrome c family protein
MTRRLFVAAAAALAVAAVVAPALTAQVPATATQTAPTFSKDIAPIFYANCTTCHRPGEVAPMSLLTFKDARPWARSIATKVKDGTMPPWHADPAVGDFVNARRLTDEQKATIIRWVDAGAPEGNPSDLPGQPKYTDGWSLGEPDVVLSMQEEFAIPATGTVPYKYFEIPTNFTEDRWLTAYEMRPGNRSVVHHVIVNLRNPQAAQQPQQQADAASRPKPSIEPAEGMEIPPGQTGGRALPEGQRKPLAANERSPRGVMGTLGGYVPGNAIRVLPKGTAVRIPAGSSLVFQMHYTPVGEATTDRTRIGLYLAKEPPKIVLNGTALVNGSLHIPAGAADHRVDAEATVNRDILLWSMVPHTHMRGKRWLYEVEYPDGRRQTILSVPNYDFEWQHEYQFREPLKLPQGSKIHASAWYDNSKSNRYNPDPTQEVWWGDQTWEEMMFTAINFSVVGAPSPSTTRQQQ